MARRMRRSSSRVPDRRDGGIERGVEAVTVEGLEQPVATNRSWSRVRISTKARWVPVTLSSGSSCSSIRAAETSMSVIASHWTTSHDGWRSATMWRTCVLNSEQLAKKSGASQR